MINYLANLFKLNFSDVNSARYDKFCYYDNAQEIVIPPNSLVLNIDIEYGKQELFRFYNEKMYFPYFGFNWDALRDCVSDASWVTEKNIVIIHSVMPLQEYIHIYHYIDILNEAILTQDESHRYYIYFPMALKRKVERVISTIPNVSKDM